MIISGEENGAKMTVELLLFLCAVTVIQLTSSQSTQDTDQHMNEADRCERSESEQVLSQLLQAVLQLQKDVAAIRQTPLKGRL